MKSYHSYAVEDRVGFADWCNRILGKARLHKIDKNFSRKIVYGPYYIVLKKLHAVFIFSFRKRARRVGRKGTLLADPKIFKP